MDWGSVIGLILAVAGIILGQKLEGGNVESLLQYAAFLIVMFGTFGAVLVQTPAKTFFARFKNAKTSI